MDSDYVSAKIKEYEQFFEGTLKADLGRIEKILLATVEKYKNWEEVKQVVKTMKEFKEKDRDMMVRVPIGCGVHAFGEVNEYERTYVDIGLGYLLEMDCEEADKYADIRMKHLKKEIDHHRELAVNVKVNMKMVLLAINELQSSIWDVDKKWKSK